MRDGTDAPTSTDDAEREPRGPVTGPLRRRAVERTAAVWTSTGRVRVRRSCCCGLAAARRPRRLVRRRIVGGRRRTGWEDHAGVQSARLCGFRLVTSGAAHANLATPSRALRNRFGTSTDFVHRLWSDERPPLKAVPMPEQGMASRLMDLWRFVVRFGYVEPTGPTPTGLPTSHMVIADDFRTKPNSAAPPTGPRAVAWSKAPLLVAMYRQLP
jgi:hypothetical protein